MLHGVMHCSQLLEFEVAMELHATFCEMFVDNQSESTTVPDLSGMQHECDWVLWTFEQSPPALLTRIIRSRSRPSDQL
jgi:hypothetical protein